VVIRELNIYFKKIKKVGGWIYNLIAVNVLERRGMELLA
jgi:hypothetical protein